MNNKENKDGKVALFLADLWAWKSMLIPSFFATILIIFLSNGSTFIITLACFAFLIWCYGTLFSNSVEKGLMLFISLILFGFAVSRIDPEILRKMEQEGRAVNSRQIAPNFGNSTSLNKK